jgi:hypothetical protein
MPPYDMWLRGRDDLLAWWFGAGIGCQGSRMIPVADANGSPAFGQYKPDPDGGQEPWALQVVELSGGRIAEFTFFLDTERVFAMPGKLDQAQEIGRRVAELDLVAAPAGGQLQAGEQIDRARGRGQAAHVADDRAWTCRGHLPFWTCRMPQNHRRRRGAMIFARPPGLSPDG